MKNKRIVDSWNKIEPNAAAEARMLDSILARNDSGEAEEGKVRTMNKVFNWKRLAPIAVCLILAIAVAIPFLNKRNGDFALKLSNGVNVYYVDNPPNIANKSDLMWLSEDELFALNFNSYEIIAFEGTVKEVRNIVCEYNGSNDYRAIATIEVSEMLRGNLEAGNTVTVLLPAPVGMDLKVEDTSVSSQITAGTTGIFLPIKYDETSIREENGKTLALLDLAEYGFLDGERWMFIETAKGLVYDKYAYPSFAKAKDLKDVKEIVFSKIK
jgi:hypothetical protein